MKLPWLTPSEALNRPLFRQQMDEAAYKALLQAEYIYGATSDDRKFKKIQRKN